MIKFIRRKLGIKDYKSCQVCGMVYEAPKASDHDNFLYDFLCPEHRKPKLEQLAMERWAKGWASRKPEEAKKIKEQDDKEFAQQQKDYIGYQLSALAQYNALNQANQNSPGALGSLGGCLGNRLVDF